MNHVVITAFIHCNYNLAPYTFKTDYNYNRGRVTDLVLLMFSKLCAVNAIITTTHFLLLGMAAAEPLEVNGHRQFCVIRKPQAYRGHNSWWTEAILRSELRVNKEMGIHCYVHTFWMNDS